MHIHICSYKVKRVSMVPSVIKTVANGTVESTINWGYRNRW